tara:strand:- start:620 stop:856 length:237 start_codon:yes stop_codon:yes gene_type:complete
MTEFTNGILVTIKNKVDDSILLALIFFLGHILIAMMVVSMITGASIWEAGAVALVEPAVNSVWFYVLHKLWKKFIKSS